jgi:hypothetical protein
MRKEVYLAIINQLKLIQLDADGEYVVANEIDEDLSVIKHFDIWNENLTEVYEEQPFYMPAVFIEFKQIDWGLLGKRVREAVFNINMHLITQRNMPTAHQVGYESDALKVFDLLSIINNCLHGFTGTNIGPFTNVASITDHNFEEIMHNIESFSAYVIDKSAEVTLGKTERPKIEINTTG